MNKIFFKIGILFLLITNLLATDYNKEIQGTWYYNISTPLKNGAVMIMRGSANYMFNHKNNSYTEILFKDQTGEVPVFFINSMSSWKIKNNMLLEELLKLKIVPNYELLEQVPELKRFRNMISQMYYEGLSNTSIIKNIGLMTCFLESSGSEIILTREPTFRMKKFTNINSQNLK